MKNTSMNARKPLTNAQMAFAISIAVIGCAGPVYLAIKGNPWPCIALFIASKLFLVYRKKQLSQANDQKNS